MRETITMTTVEQRRAWVLTKVIAGALEVGEAADLLGLSERSIWRLKRRFAEAALATSADGSCRGAAVNARERERAGP
jgi:hypothetical protein